MTVSYNVWHTYITKIYCTENPTMSLLPDPDVRKLKAELTQLAAEFSVDVREAILSVVDHPVYSKHFSEKLKTGKKLCIWFSEDGTNEGKKQISLYLGCGRFPQLLDPNGRQQHCEP